MENNRFLKAGILLLAALFCGNTASAQWNTAGGNVTLKTVTDKVGIGIAAPKAKLHVEGHTYANGDIIVRKILYVGDDANNTGYSDIRFGSNNLGTGEGIGSKRSTGGNHKGLDFYTGNSARVSILNNGKLLAMRQFNVGADNTNTGAIDLAFGSDGSGEGMGSKRTATGNQFGLDFYTSSANRMSITKAGDLGIGTTAPKARLHVAGHTYADGDIVVRKVLYVGDDAALNNGVSSLRFGSNGSGTGEGIGSNRDNAKPNFKGLDFYCGNTARMSILNNGNVGIGITNPAFKLTVNGGLRVENEVSVGGGGVFEVDAPGIVGGRFRIMANGKVGIGISDPAKMPGAYKLYVADGIMTERLKVALKNSANWADYVFADDYRLLPLAEVEAFLKKERHLPNVPSAAEVAQNGIDVAAMDAKLLEKIEELTLYVIGIQKENEALKSRVASLENPAK